MISVLLVGVGGYGGLIAGEVLENPEKHNAKVVGIVEPFFENSPVKDTVLSKNIPVFTDISDLT